MEPIQKGSFILEYAGEVIDERELSRRMEHARLNGEPHFYIMEMSAGGWVPRARSGGHPRAAHWCGGSLLLRRSVMGAAVCMNWCHVALADASFW